MVSRSVQKAAGGLILPIGFTMFYVGVLLSGRKGIALLWGGLLAFILGGLLIHTANSYWWLFVAVQPPLSGIAFIAEELAMIDGSSDIKAAFALIIIPSFFLYQFVAYLFPFALYLDAQISRVPAKGWHPPASIYALFGGAIYGGLAIHGFPLPRTDPPLRYFFELTATLVALGYIYKRHTTIGTIFETVQSKSLQDRSR